MVLPALALAVPGLAWADCRKLGDDVLVTLEFKPDTEIAAVIAWYAMITCLTMVVGTSIDGKKVTILAPKPIKMAEARRLFFDTLDSVGLAAEQNGKLMRIVEAKKARPRK